MQSDISALTESLFRFNFKNIMKFFKNGKYIN
jgi:hypothetical protein